MLNRRHQATGSQREVTAPYSKVLILAPNQRRIVCLKGPHSISAGYIITKKDKDKEEELPAGKIERRDVTRTQAVRIDSGIAPAIEVVKWNGKIP
jgi:hypothetical protein